MAFERVCYVAFWDEITLATQESQGQRISEDHMIGKWRIVVVKELPFLDQRLNGKIPKVVWSWTSKIGFALIDDVDAGVIGMM
ncbi:hypothetical protein QQ045_020375 [Rhodiola kirilowii]